MTVRKKRQLVKIKYNAPVTLTFSLAAFLILILDQTVLNGITRSFFSVPGRTVFVWASPVSYLRLFTHIFGHADWNHLVGNLSFILLLGPMLEQRYGSLTLMLMIGVTAFVTGVLNVCFLTTGLMGASGIAFMMILLSSFTNIEKNEVPLTFILVVVLYLGKEVINSFKSDNISEFAHLAGGICGSLFGFFTPESGPARRRTVPKQDAPAQKPGAGRKRETGQVRRAADTPDRKPDDTL